MRIEEDLIQFTFLNQNNLVNTMTSLLHNRVHLDLEDRCILFQSIQTSVVEQAGYILYTTWILFSLPEGGLVGIS